MLESPSGHDIRNIPLIRQADFYHELAEVNGRFPGAETAMRRELNQYVDARRSEFCSTWVPPEDWRSGTAVYQPIADTMLALYVDHQLAHKRAGWFFGLLLMDVMIHRPDHWLFRKERHRPEDDPEGAYYRPKV